MTPSLPIFDSFSFLKQKNLIISPTMVRYLVLSFKFYCFTSNLLLLPASRWQTLASRFEKEVMSTDSRDSKDRHQLQQKNRRKSACSRPTRWRRSRKPCRRSSVTNDRRQHRCCHVCRKIIQKLNCFPSRVTNFRQNSRRHPVSVPSRKSCHSRATSATKNISIEVILRQVFRLKTRFDL